MKILTFSTLFPNARQPTHGVFVENRLRHLVASGQVSARVVAPVPWFPSASPLFGRYAATAGVACRENRHGIEIEHPPFPTIPKVGMTLAPWLLYMGAMEAIRRQPDFDLLDAHYFYPDGVAAALIARRLNKPFTITARGTDINLIPRYALPRRMILWAARRADGMITVCQALKDSLVALGVDEHRVRVLRNGVDLDMFRPADRESARRTLGLDGAVIISVGHLIPRKGHDIAIGALPHLPGVTLLIAGDGPEEASLRSLAARLGVADRTRFLGRVAHDALPALYTAADALILASSREGWANVLLEAMACGTPVVASNVWGTPEVVATPEAGLLMQDRTPDALAAAVRALLASPPDRHRTRLYAERFSWDATTQGQIELFSHILRSRTSSVTSSAAGGQEANSEEAGCAMAAPPPSRRS